LGGNRVHAVGGRARQDLVFARGAEGADKSVNGFIAANTDEEVVGCQVLFCVGVGVAEVAEQLLELRLVAVESCQARVLW
jgi:N-acetylglutamate synthase-like GNAT family acetyltransferase